MNITLTGSLGRIGAPLADQLLKNGHHVTIISSNHAKQSTIEELGATAAIGSIEDVTFLAKTFAGSDIVYLMEPPPNFLDKTTNTHEQWTGLAKTYKQAVELSGVTNIIHLSSIGAHTTDGVGMLASHYYVEQILNTLPAAVSIKFMRPVGFYYNMFAFIPSIKAAGAIFQNYGGDEKEPWVSPLDISDAIVEEMQSPFEGRSIRYIASEEISPNEIARILGNAIGKPDLQWIVIPDTQFEERLLQIGFNAQSAKGLTEMNIGRRHHLYDDYNRHRPTLGNIKVTDFAKDFARAYESNQSTH